MALPGQPCQGKEARLNLIAEPSAVAVRRDYRHGISGHRISFQPVRVADQGIRGGMLPQGAELNRQLVRQRRLPAQAAAKIQGLSFNEGKRGYDQRIVTVAVRDSRTRWIDDRFTWR